MTDMFIRQATAEDAEAIFEIENLCFSDPWSLESIIYEFEQNPAAFYVVAEIEVDNEAGEGGQAPDEAASKSGGSGSESRLIVGYAGLWWIEDEGHITNVAVRPGFRNRRIGSQILETLIDFTGEEGINSYTLEVRKSNEAAIALYEKYGFAIEGLRRNYYPHGRKGREDALILWRRNEDQKTSVSTER